MSGEEALATMREAVLRVCPDLSGAAFTVKDEGWDSVALDVDDRWIFKFPRNAGAEASLIREAALLEHARKRVSMPVPHLQIHSGPPLFSSHEKLPGDHLTSEGYARLPAEARGDLAEKLGRFFAELHGLDLGTVEAAGAKPIGAWQPPAVIRDKALPMLSPKVREAAEACLTAYEQMAPDPLGQVYGFFDGHGWNMAFDHEAGRLNGMYDFADSGLGPRHQEFIYPGFIALELVDRTADAYERATGCVLDRDRIHILSGILHLSELAEMGGDPAWATRLIPYVNAWAEHRTC